MQLVCLLIDRVDKADDNAEFFYHWLKINKPEVRVYFGLERTAEDWDRLEKENFNLIDLNNLTHYKELLKEVTHILVSNPVKKIKDIAPNAVRIFLQHGITNRRAKASADYVNDCGKWADYVLATSEAEKTLLTTDPYKLKKEQVFVTGFPRHDSLCKKALQTPKKYICLQPHWAMYLTDPDKQLLSSEYFKGWKKLLNSPELKQYSQRTGIKIAFRLHPCSYKYEREWLAILPSYIKYIDKNESFQQTFVESLVYVSDYSSNMFEVGIIDTPCIYYRPDAEFIRTHTNAGDFEKGILGVIGPSTYAVDQFMGQLYKCTQNHFNADSRYQQTRALVFPYKLDTKNCERVYNLIIMKTKQKKPERLIIKQKKDYLNEIGALPSLDDYMK